MEMNDVTQGENSGGFLSTNCVCNIATVDLITKRVTKELTGTQHMQGVSGKRMIPIPRKVQWYEIS